MNINQEEKRENYSISGTVGIDGRWSSRVKPDESEFGSIAKNASRFIGAAAIARGREHSQQFPFLLNLRPQKKENKIIQTGVE